MVYTGFSLGVMPAQRLAQTRAGARGALLFHACLPVSEFGESWPAGVPVQIHGMDTDPEFVDGGDLDAARALVDSTDQAELFLYPGDKHLFADSSLPSHDEAAAALLTSRALDFLEGLPRPTASSICDVARRARASPCRASRWERMQEASYLGKFADKDKQKGCPAGSKSTR